MFEDLVCASRRFWRGKGTQLITNYQEFADKKNANVEKVDEALKTAMKQKEKAMRQKRKPLRHPQYFLYTPENPS